MPSDTPSSIPPLLDDCFHISRHERLHDGFMKFDTYRVTQRRFDGGVSPTLNREVMVAREAAAVLLYDPVRDAVVLIEQARLPVALAGFASISREVVAGLIEAHEEPAAVACREVLEETGLSVIGEPQLIVNMLVSPGNTTQLVRLYCAQVDAAIAGGHHGLAEENEDIRVVVQDYESFAAGIRQGTPENAIALVAGYWLIEHRSELRKLWISGKE